VTDQGHSSDDEPDEGRGGLIRVACFSHLSLRNVPHTFRCLAINRRRLMITTWRVKMATKMKMSRHSHALNRITNKTYYDGVTPAVTYCYDGSTTSPCDHAPTGSYMLGRLTMVLTPRPNTVPSTPWDGLLQSKQDGYQFSYSHNLAGALSSMTYPSGRTVSYNYDGAGRVNEVVNYTSSTTKIGYAPHGAIASIVLKNGLTETTTFNNRLQTTEILVATPAGSTLLDLTNSYGTSNNNGNLLSQSINPLGVTQRYAYDSVNRLAVAVEQGSTLTGLSCPSGILYWCESYGYDQYGNRWVNQALTGNGLALTEPGVTPRSSSWFNSSNNRVSYGTVYDGAGNQTQASGQQGSLVYDADNRLTTVNLFSGVVGQPKTYSYSYDGDGRRIGKSLDGLNLNATYLYSATGQLASEYQNGSWLKDHIYLNGRLLAVEDTRQGTSGASYVTPDQLGSTRLVTNASGNVISRHDYLPFGKEVSASLGSRNSYLVTGYVESGSACPLVTPPNTSTTDCQPADERVLQRFTGKEADAETGLDYFGKRYFSAAQGRFMSVDGHNEGAQLLDPQSWNGYAYAGNNPLRFTDRDGQDYHVCDANGSNCADLSDDQYKKYRAMNPDIKRTASGELYVINTDGSTTTVGSATWFNGNAVRQNENAMAMLNFFVVNQSMNMLSEGFGAWLESLRAARLSSEAIQVGIRVQGAAAERIAAVQLGLKGYRIVGAQVRVMTSEGLRVVDFIVEREGEYVAIEVKSMGAVRDAGQLAKDAAMATEGGEIGTAKGGVALREITGQVLKLKTIVVRPF
jgi:RHS repeat-associated protein